MNLLIRNVAFINTFAKLKNLKMKKLLFFSFCVALISCGNKDNSPKEPTQQPAAPLSKSKNSEAFNQSFEKALTAYIHLKDNFITESIPMQNYYAIQLNNSLDSLKFSELKGDAGIGENAKSFSQGLIGELKTFGAEKDLTKKRKIFNSLSDQFYNLIRIVQYDQKVIYHHHYANAFTDGDPNAYWLSLTSDIKNPYNPKELLQGELVDSLDYSK